MATMRRILFFLCLLVLGRTNPILNECDIISILHGELLYDNRTTYMRDNFPIDYKLNVKYEEVLRCQNISSLTSKGESLEALRHLWGVTNGHVLDAIQEVLPSKHPSRKYIDGLKKLVTDLRNRWKDPDSDRVLEILDRQSSSDNVRVKAVTPKALLDNCYKVMFVLYEEECGLCNPRSDMEDPLCPSETLPPLSNRTCGQGS